jgi:hypothetical protein
MAQSNDDKGNGKQDRVIHFTVDGEPVETDQRTLTANEIIAKFGGGLDVSTHYLVEIKEGRQVSFQGKGNDPVELHNGLAFQIIAIGPMPLSESPIRTGIEVFVEGLQKLGFNPASLEGKPDHIYIDYEVKGGRLAGTKVRHGFVVPTDFPVSAPSGPHVSPHVHPIKGDGAHPTGAIHETHAKPFQDALGGKWQYWSRPFLDWGNTKKTVAMYMNHIRRLWDSQ